MRHSRISLAIAAVMFISAPAIAQERDLSKGKAPTGPAPEVAQGAPVPSLPGNTCTLGGGTNCPSASFSTSVTSSFDIQGCVEGDIINDLNVGLDISHAWVGDLKITLTSPDATSVVIMDQPGTPNTGDGGGCSGQHVNAVLDDSGASPVEDACYSPPPAIAGALVPNNPLAAFNGQQGTGTWTLLIEDFFPIDNGVLNDWSLEPSCGDPTVSRATFRVTKDFSDDNPGEVNVSIDCNTGLILDQDKLISEGEYVEFVVTQFTNGAMSCTITEDVPAGYSTEYFSNGASNSVECEFEDVGFGSAHSCRIVNTPEPVSLTVNKTWLYPGSEDSTDEGYDLHFYCDAEIEGGYDYSPTEWYYDMYGLEGNGSNSITVHPSWQGNTCWVSEDAYSDFAESDSSDCQGVAIELGSDASCDIINTVFYEGIPTLSHYGIAVLALSLLGLGMVGFRRYS